MAAVGHIVVRNSITAAVCALKNLGIPVSGPFVTPRQHCFYLVDGCIVTLSELLGLQEGRKLTHENVATILSNLRELQNSYDAKRQSDEHSL